jgi:hypothetical protein
VFDNLTSNDWFAVETHGAGYRRTEKARAILPFPEVVRALKVCIDLRRAEDNCGRCWKCLVTRINFLAAGEPNPACFDAPLTAAEIDAFPVTRLDRNLAVLAWADGWQALPPAIREALDRKVAAGTPHTNLFAPLSRHGRQDMLRATGRAVRSLVPAPLRARIRARLPASLRP